MTDNQPQASQQQEPAYRITRKPTKREGQAGVSQENQWPVVIMLNPHQRVLHEILDVGFVHFRRCIVPEHPSNVGKPESATGGIGIFGQIIYMSMMLPVVRAPDFDGILQSQGATESEQQSDNKMGVI